MKSEIDRLCDHLKIGESLNVSKADFEDAYQVFGLPREERTSVQVFLSNKVGSAYGTYRVRFDLISQHYIISKHEGSQCYYDEHRRNYWEERYS